MVERAQLIIDWYSTLPYAVRVEKSRIGQLCQAVQRNATKGNIQPGAEDFDTLLLGLVELSELWFIAQFLGDLSTDQRFSQAFKHLAGDDLHPADLVANSPGRDAQWELFCASVATRAGFQIERSDAGADLVLVADGRRTSIECKRIHSYKKLATLMRKAATQIKDTGYAGWICMDVSLIMSDGTLISVLDGYSPDDVVKRAAEASAKRFRADHLKLLCTSTLGTPVGFFQWRDCVVVPPGQLPDGSHSQWSAQNYWHTIPVKPLESPSRLAVEQAIQLFSYALPNV